MVGMPNLGAPPKVPKPKAASGAPRFQRSVRPPTNFPHVAPSRRDYGKGAQAAENPLGVVEGAKTGFGQTGLTGES